MSDDKPAPLAPANHRLPMQLGPQDAQLVSLRRETNDKWNAALDDLADQARLGRNPLAAHDLNEHLRDECAGVEMLDGALVGRNPEAA